MYYLNHLLVLIEDIWHLIYCRQFCNSYNILVYIAVLTYLLYKQWHKAMIFRNSGKCRSDRMGRHLALLSVCKMSLYFHLMGSNGKGHHSLGEKKRILKFESEMYIFLMMVTKHVSYFQYSIQNFYSGGDFRTSEGGGDIVPYFGESLFGPLISGKFKIFPGWYFFPSRISAWNHHWLHHILWIKSFCCCCCFV